MKQGDINVSNFATGGTVGSSTDVSGRYKTGQRVPSANTTNVTIVQNISTPDANSFRRSEGQVARDSAAAARRAYERNG